MNRLKPIDRKLWDDLEKSVREQIAFARRVSREYDASPKTSEPAIVIQLPKSKSS